jgi:hypothetical protein
MAGVRAPLMAACQARERGERGERRRWAGARLGARLGAWGWLLGGGAQEGGLGVGCLCVLCAAHVLVDREEGEKEEESRKREEKKRKKKKKKKIWKKFQT